MKKTEITKASKTLTARERIELKKGSHLVSLKNELDEKQEMSVKPSFYALLSTVDEQTGECKETLVFEDGVSGKRYRTGSTVFMQNFLMIAEEMNEESFDLLCKRVKSKKGAGFYLDCDMI